MPPEGGWWCRCASGRQLVSDRYNSELGDRYNSDWYNSEQFFEPPDNSEQLFEPPDIHYHCADFANAERQ